MTDPFILFDSGPNKRPEAFIRPSQVITAWQPEDIAGAFEELKKAQTAGKWLAGYASYELGYALEGRLKPLMHSDRKTPLFSFGVFSRPNHAAAKRILKQAKAEQNTISVSEFTPQQSRADYEAAFKRVKEYIKAGDIYQANLSFPMTGSFKGSALGLYAALRAVQPVPHGAMVSFDGGPILLSRSPELFFNTDADGKITTRPMKGTAPRGNTPAEDALIAKTLQADPKNRAENLMIVDLLRNDISRISKVGSVKVPELFKVEHYKTVHQMTSLIEAQLKAGTDLTDMLKALFPCGSITGAPKIRAMEILRELEPNARNAYCGAIGWMAPDGTSEFNVAIRTLSIDVNNAITLNVGGGVVYDSAVQSEYEEALWKARYATLLQKT